MRYMWSEMLQRVSITIDLSDACTSRRRESGHDHHVFATQSLVVNIDLLDEPASAFLGLRFASEAWIRTVVVRSDHQSLQDVKERHQVLGLVT